MWDGLAVLLFLSASLAASSYLAGILPLSFSLSQKRMRLLTACGTGILVGTALIVIIPEGVETLYSSREIGSKHSHRISRRDSGSAVVSSTGLRAFEAEHENAGDQVQLGAEEVLIKQTISSRDTQLKRRRIGDKDSKADEHAAGGSEDSSEHDHDGDHQFEPHGWVGVSIITGFVLMFLIDKLPKVSSASAHLRPAYISLERMGLRGGSEAEEDAEDLAQPPDSGRFRPSSTTTGLVIHAAADGIALGASSTASTKKLSMIIFFALMIHKAPAAFGLTAVLLKQGLSRRKAKAHLVVFSLAAPVGALVTWSLAHILGGGTLGHETKTTFVTGLLLLFSGGTFLYVAMHTMQDGGHAHSAENGGTENGYADIYQQQTLKQAEGPTLIDTLATVGGMLLPLLTQFGHAH
ncbi:Zinc transporter ZIP9-B [Sphaceloma murrayae]|uniref:Zinc transporter ZIP9-B n=1 Tax=Sphaceloma murrayae TaxID=2082308 RepID=A0A2K1QX21_9PEZI|nr:Zinc transporter ZIP9-B [Sphaceloma murrayae]